MTGPQRVRNEHGTEGQAKPHVHRWNGGRCAGCGAEVVYTSEQVRRYAQDHPELLDLIKAESQSTTEPEPEPDWRDALVVRDPDGYYWLRRNDVHWESHRPEFEYNAQTTGELSDLGPITVVIDADGRNVEAEDLHRQLSDRTAALQNETEHCEGVYAKLRAAEERAENLESARAHIGRRLKAAKDQLVANDDEWEQMVDARNDEIDRLRRKIKKLKKQRDRLSGALTEFAGWARAKQREATEAGNESARAGRPDHRSWWGAANAYTVTADRAEQRAKRIGGGK